MTKKPTSPTPVQFAKAVVLAMIITLGLTRCMSEGPKDVYKQVVKLESSRGSCSGEQVVAASGLTYILTAAHCRVLEEGGSITAKTDDGRELKRRIIQVDDKSDLMLLEGIPSLSGLTIAQESHARDHVETFTHGSGYPTYRTDGVIVGDTEVKFIIDIIDSPEAAAKCSGGTFLIDSVMTIFGEVKVCVFSATETITTAFITPGSSGGPVVNDKHELVGVVSAGDSEHKFGYLVRLKDIRAFLANY